MTDHIPHLLEEQTISFYPSLAMLIGVNQAIILQQLHFLIGITKKAKNESNFIDGRWWVYNSYPQWKEDHFMWLGQSTIKRFFLELEAKGIVLSRQGVKSPVDRRKWYTIDYEKWIDFVTEHELRCASPSAQNEPMTVSKRSNGASAQKSPMKGSKKSHVIGTESTTENTAESTPLPFHIAHGWGMTGAQVQNADLLAIKGYPVWQAFKRGWDGLEPDFPPTMAKTVRIAIDVLTTDIQAGKYSLNDIECLTRQKLANPKTQGYRITFIKTDIAEYLAAKRAKQNSAVIHIDPNDQPDDADSATKWMRKVEAS